MTLNHGKIITTKSYNDGVEVCVKEEYSVPVFTTKETLLKDMIDALTPLTTNQTTKLDISIKIDSKGRWMLEKRWPVA